MYKYVDRLMKCGYQFDAAYNVCRCFIKDFSIVELDMFVTSVEMRLCHVD